MSIITIVIAVVGFVAGWIVREAVKPKDHPLIDSIRKMLSEQSKKSKEINVEEEIKKLKGGA